MFYVSLVGSFVLYEGNNQNQNHAYFASSREITKR